MSETTVFLVRHGEVHNPERVNYGRLPGFFLSERGRSQVREAAERLRSHLSASTPVWSSPLERAVETAELLRSHLALSEPVRTDERLLEAASRYDGLRRSRDLVGHLRRALSNDEKHQHEAPERIAQRMLHAIEALASAHATVVLVSHQLPIQYARLSVRRAKQAETSLLAKLSWGVRPRCNTASITMLAMHNGALTERAYWD